MLIFIVLSTFICQTYNYYVNVYVHIMLSWNDNNKQSLECFIEHLS